MQVLEHTLFWHPCGVFSLLFFKFPFCFLSFISPSQILSFISTQFLNRNFLVFSYQFSGLVNQSCPYLFLNSTERRLLHFSLKVCGAVCEGKGQEVWEEQSECIWMNLICGSEAALKGERLLVCFLQKRDILSLGMAWQLKKEDLRTLRPLFASWRDHHYFLGWITLIFFLFWGFDFSTLLRWARVTFFSEIEKSFFLFLQWSVWDGALFSLFIKAQAPGRQGGSVG